MSHDLVADGLNMLMNAKRAGKHEILINKSSKLLLAVLDIAKKKKYLDYAVDEKNKAIKVALKNINNCRAIKPRFYVKVEEIEKYMKRYLPARGFGIIILSTSKGLLTHEEAYEKNIGGGLIAYFF